MAIGRSEEAGTPGRQRDYLKLFMALCCLSAVGIAGSTYDSTLESDPDEIIDVKHEWLPIGKDKIQNFKDPDRSDSASAGGGGGGSSEEPNPCTGGFIGVLASLFPSLIPPCGPFYLLGLLIPVLLLVVALSLLYRYRRLLIAPILAVWAWLRDLRQGVGDTGPGAWPRAKPTNEVHRAWLSMVERADIDRPETQAPRECSRAAIEAGMESEPVQTLTTLFEDVRYGDVPLTDERQTRARDCTQRLTDGHGRRMKPPRGGSS